MKRIINRTSLTPHIILISLGLLVILHLIGLTLYTQHHKARLYMAARDGAIQQVMNIVHMVQATPLDQMHNAIKTMNLPNTTVSLSIKPQWPLHVSNLTFWRINQLVPGDANTVTLSLYIPGGEWVNVKANIIPVDVWPQLTLFGLEALMAFIFLFYVWSINRFTEPLQRFKSAAEQLGVEFKLTPLDNIKGPSIVKETASAMNTMQQRIQELLNNRTLMLAAISHDLRTPLTRLKLRASFIDDPELVEKTNHDCDEMEAMISDILAFARNAHQQKVLHTFNVNTLLQSISQNFRECGHQVTVTPNDQEIFVKSDPIILKRCFNNIIENAIKYGETCTVRLEMHKKFIGIFFQDQGPGIPLDEIEHIFEPFYRCEHSRSRLTAGTGLGLAIAHDAIKSHHGKISARNIKPQGLEIIIHLPLS